MKNYKFLILISFAFSIIFNSCSIEKRVHRSGYHIEWRSKHSVSSTPNPKVKEELPIVENKVFNKDKENHTSDRVEDSENSHTDIHLPVISENTNTTVTENHITIDYPSDINKQIQTTSEIKSKSNPVNVNESMKGLGDSGKSGWFFIVAALLLFLLAWVFYVYLGIFGIILGLIFVIGAGIYFIVGLIIILTNL